MNREIKFRAWDKTFNKMIEVTDLNLDNRSLIGYMGERLVSCRFDDCELLQYTGLKDKNGVEIYEGDIIRYFSEVMSKKEWICSVEVIGATFAVRTGKKSYMDGSFLNRLSKDEKLEIIGNIYENPELEEENK